MITIQPQDYNYWKVRPEIDDGDWLDGKGDWVRGYWESMNHPHRALICAAVKEVGADKKAPDSIFNVCELGAACGPNLARLVRDLKISELKLAGIDANVHAVELGREKLPEVNWHIGDFTKLPWGDESSLVCLADAVLMYLDPDRIGMVIHEMNRVAQKAIIIIDRYDKNPLGVLTSKGHIWARDYSRLLKNYGWKVEMIKLTEKDWPTSQGWIRDGYLWKATR